MIFILILYTLQLIYPPACFCLRFEAIIGGRVGRVVGVVVVGCRSDWWPGVANGAIAQRGRAAVQSPPHEARLPHTCSDDCPTRLPHACSDDCPHTCSDDCKGRR